MPFKRVMLDDLMSGGMSLYVYCLDLDKAPLERGSSVVDALRTFHIHHQAPRRSRYKHLLSRPDDPLYVMRGRLLLPEQRGGEPRAVAAPALPPVRRPQSLPRPGHRASRPQAQQHRSRLHRDDLLHHRTSTHPFFPHVAFVTMQADRAVLCTMCRCWIGARAASVPP